MGLEAARYARVLEEHRRHELAVLDGLLANLAFDRATRPRQPATPALGEDEGRFVGCTEPSRARPGGDQEC